MHYLITAAALLTLILLNSPALAQTSEAISETIKEAISGPSPEATAIIEEFGLNEGAVAMADYPGWQPQRVVVSVPPGMSNVLPDLEQQLEDAAGTTELVIDRSNHFLPDARVLAGADALIGLCTVAAMNNVDSSLLWLHSYTVGMDRCAGLEEEQLAGRVFTNNKRLASPAIAEHTIAMMLSLARGLPIYQRAQNNGRWDRALAQQARFGEIQGKTMLVVGLGGIGTRVASHAHGLGMRVIATRNSSREGPDYVEYVGLANELGKLAGQADVIVNALPLTGKTTGLFDHDFFQQVKPGAIFISVGRGRSTVTMDLIAALESGQLYGAGLDVTDPEPLPADHPLWRMSNVIITPHISGADMGSMQRTTIIAVENLRRYVAGEPLLNIVDMQAGY